MQFRPLDKTDTQAATIRLPDARAVTFWFGHQ